LDEYLKFFDVETLRDGSSAHRDRANRENEVFLEMLRLGPDTEGMARPIVIFEDDDDIHMAEHAEAFVKNFEEFRNNEALMTEFITHTERHRLQKEEKMAKLMPGASTQVVPMMGQAQQQALPTVGTVYMDSQMRRQAEAAQQGKSQPQGQQGPGQEKKPASPKAPQSPRQPSGPGQGAGRIDPNAPSGNTPAAKGGMI
jgi:hypothetical protein